MTLSPQSQSVYQQLLEAEGPLSAKDLGKKLNIFPSTVYRLTDPLLEMGLITKTEKYPYQFNAKSVNEGLSLFLLQQNEWFSRQFLPFSKKEKQSKKGNAKSNDIEFSFIQSRDELMNESAREFAKATKSVDLLRSGHEIPADVMLSIMEAQKRGVVARMLIQDYSEENKEQVAYWQKNGIQVRRTPHRHIRLMLYDSAVVYFMSYKNTDSPKDLGMKISYAPFAAILSRLFEQWWREAEII